MTYERAREICFENKVCQFGFDIKFLDNVEEFCLKIKLNEKCIEKYFSLSYFSIISEQLFECIVKQSIRECLSIDHNCL